MPTQSSKKADATPKKERKSRTRSTPASPAAAPALHSVPTDGVDKYMPTAWGGGTTNTGPQDLEMPSGQIALVRRPGIQQLMVEGVLHKMDNLTALVDKKYIKKGGTGKPSDNIDVGGLIGDPEAMSQILHTVDRVVCAVVVRPQVQMTPNDPTRRIPGVIYADSVDLQDKMFIFNWSVGGSKDLESFRRESEAIVGGLAAGDAVEPETE